jgi:Hypervirulence associated proteins TUDOR domain
MAESLDQVRLGADANAKPELARSLNHEENPMTERYKIGDRVAWNSEAGRVSGTIIRVHTRDFNYKGHNHHASPDSPQYEIKSSKTGHIAAHKGSALSKLSD